MPNGDSAKSAPTSWISQAEAQVRLVRAVPGHRLRVRHAPERPRHLDADHAERGGQRAFDHARRPVSGRGERHLEVDLRELELPVGAQVLVAEAARDLHVAVHPGNHQDLLEDLRRLRQREELAGMHAARHEEVARALRRRLGQDRRLDLPESLVVEVVPQRQGDAVAQPDVALQPGPAQIEIAVLEPRLLRRRWPPRQSETAASSPRSGSGRPCARTSTSPVGSLAFDRVRRRAARPGPRRRPRTPRAAAWPARAAPRRPRR